MVYDIVHVDSAVRKECSEGIFVIKYVIYGSVNHLTIFVTCSTHLFEHFHDAINDRLAPFFTELQAMFWTLAILVSVQKYQNVSVQKCQNAFICGLLAKSTNFVFYFLSQKKSSLQTNCHRKQVLVVRPTKLHGLE